MLLPTLIVEILSPGDEFQPTLIFSVALVVKVSVADAVTRMFLSSALAWVDENEWVLCDDICFKLVFEISSPDFQVGDEVVCLNFNYIKN